MKHLYLTFAIVLFSLNYGFGQCSAAFTANVSSCDETVTFTADSAGTNVGNLTYTWDFGSGGVTATGSTASFTYPVVNGGGTNSYTVTLTVTGPICSTNSTSQNVVIDQKPIAALNEQNSFNYCGIT
ncbi:MAG: PKD repeat protein, partial [Saprospiraceae bacterium]